MLLDELAVLLVVQIELLGARARRVKRRRPSTLRESGVLKLRERDPRSKAITAKKRRRIDPVTIIISSDDDDDDENEGANNPNAGHLEEVRLLKRVDQLKAVAMVVGMRL